MKTCGGKKSCLMYFEHSNMCKMCHFFHLCRCEDPKDDVVLTSCCSDESFKSYGLQPRLHHQASSGLIFSGTLRPVSMRKERQNFVPLLLS